jgi:cation:H+ antiporter
MRVSVFWSGRHPHGEPFQMAESAEVRRAAAASPLGLLALCVGGLALVVLASRVLIVAVTELAEAHWHVPKVVIAATLVALGTSLPELVIGVTSIAKGHHEILVGNVIGADVLNVLFVVGASAVAAPLHILDAAANVPGILLYLHLPVMLAVLVLFRVFIHAARRTGRFQRWQGLPLVAIYITYVVLQYVVTRA